MTTLRLVEALPKSEGVSEVAVLEEALKVLARGADQRVARHVKVLAEYPDSKRQFLVSIQRPCNYLHISAHGRASSQGGCLFLRGGGVLNPEDLNHARIQATTVFVNA